MSQPSTEPTEPATDPVTDPTGQEPPEPTGEPTDPTPPVTDPEPTDPHSGGLDELPESWQKEIKRLRSEAGKARTQAAEKAAAEARKAAEAEAAAVLDQERAANAERLKRIAKELGLSGDDQPDLTPEQVIEKITAERDAEKTAREENAKAFAELALEVAVQDAANMHEARSARLLDSRSFMREVRKLDPKADGYRAAVADAVSKAVEGDPDLKEAKRPTPPAVSGGNTVAGSKTRKTEDMTVDELIAAGFTKRR